MTAGQAPAARRPDGGRLIVQKFGGSSVVDAARIRLCAQRAVDAHRAGSQVVVVVSAMGRTTDALVRTARELDQSPAPRELDQLLAAGEQVSVSLAAIAINAIGGRAIGFDARQAGIAADGHHGRARITAIDEARVRAVFESGAIAVVAGFQGVMPEGDIATIGRGGSDTTAVSLAAALNADVCEINTDAPGVMTADPALVPEPQLLESLNWGDLTVFAKHGATVIAHDAAAMAEEHAIPLRIRHAALAGGGTLVGDYPRKSGPIGCAATFDEALATLSLVGLSMSEGDNEVVDRVFGPGAERTPEGVFLRDVEHEKARIILRSLHASFWQ